MARVLVRDLTKQYAPHVKPVDSITFEAEDRSFLTLLGPSGCGKSTILRMVAGLETVTAGEIHIGERLVNDLHPSQRDIAMVFQSYALYPHMSVFENIAVNLRLKKVPGGEIARRVRETAELLDIVPLLDRRPKELSGGQRQRVALGRAIIRKPAVFLLDEPLSNLDAILREKMRAELKALFAELGATVLYVTHDQTEAMTMSGRIAVLNAGKIQQLGTPDDVYNRPANVFVANFVGSPRINVIPARVEDGAVAVGAQKVPIPAARLDGRRDVLLGVRPEDVRIDDDSGNGSGSGGPRGRVRLVEPLGPFSLVELDVGGQRLTALADPRRQWGEHVGFSFAGEHVHFFDPATEQRIA